MCLRAADGAYGTVSISWPGGRGPTSEQTSTLRHAGTADDSPLARRFGEWHATVAPRLTGAGFLDRVLRERAGTQVSTISYQRFR